MLFANASLVRAVSSLHSPHLSSVGKLVDLSDGDSRNHQTRGHDAYAGQNFIPHDEGFKLSGDKGQ